MDISQYSKFIALGVETNGSGEVIEVAAVEFSQTGRLLTKPYSRRFNCQSAITVEAVTKHGIRASDLVGCKYYFEKQASNRIKHLCNDMPIVGHNLSLDLSVLNFEYVTNPARFDTAEMYQSIFKEKYDLAETCQKAGLHRKDASKYSSDIPETSAYTSALLSAVQAMRLFVWLSKPGRGKEQEEMVIVEKPKPVVVKEDGSKIACVGLSFALFRWRSRGRTLSHRGGVDVRV